MRGDTIFAPGDDQLLMWRIYQPARVASQGPGAPRVKPRRLLPWGSYHLPFVTCKFVHLDAHWRHRAPLSSAFAIGVSIERGSRGRRQWLLKNHTRLISPRSARSTRSEGGGGGGGNCRLTLAVISSTSSRRINRRDYDHGASTPRARALQSTASRARSLVRSK